MEKTIDYTYDPLNRPAPTRGFRRGLTGASYDDGSSFAYTYDAVGNRLTENAKEETNQYTYDAANRLASVNGQAYTYDANGNLLADGTKTYTYNYSNRLTQVTSGADTYLYVYNGLGDRLQSIFNGTATTYSLDLNSSLTQVLADGTNTYTYGLNRIAQVAETQTGYFLGDALGSVRQVGDSKAEILLAQSYSPYGEVLSSLGDYETVYSYTGEMTDGTGLVNLRARHYDPGTGRFISRDTWAGDYQSPITLNRWTYAVGNPINRTDPSGFIAEGSEEEDAQNIVNDLIKYEVQIVKDWGPSMFFVTFQDPNKPPQNTCGWVSGNWTMKELNQVKDAVEKLATAMGGDQQFIINTSGIRIDQRTLPTGYQGLTEAHYISYTDASASFTPWSTMHELAHVWDADLFWSLSKRLEEITGGYTDPEESKKKWANGECTYNWESGCNAAGYFFSGNPAKGADTNFNRREDFAESVTTYYYSNEALNWISKYMSREYKIKYSYTDYSKESRWKFVKGLFK